MVERSLNFYLVSYEPGDVDLIREVSNLEVLTINVFLFVNF